VLIFYSPESAVFVLAKDDFGFSSMPPESAVFIRYAVVVREFSRSE
jgi:hypothetical protein